MLKSIVRQWPALYTQHWGKNGQRIRPKIASTPFDNKNNNQKSKVKRSIRSTSLNIYGTWHGWFWSFKVKLIGYLLEWIGESPIVTATQKPNLCVCQSNSWRTTFFFSTSMKFSPSPLSFAKLDQIHKTNRKLFGEQIFFPPRKYDKYCIYHGRHMVSIALNQRWKNFSLHQNE